jgi:hypothetical protein
MPLAVPAGIIADSYNKASGWSPLSLPNLRSWFDASDASTFTYSSSTLVSQWNDKSGNGKHAVQATVANQPNRNVTQNGLSCVAFSGTGNVHMRANGTFLVGTPWDENHPHTLIVIAKVTGSPGGTQRSPIAAGNTRPFRTTADKAAMYATTAVVDSGVAFGANAHLVVCRIAGNTGLSGIGVDGAAFVVGFPGNQGNLDFWIGAYSAGEYWMGNICEVITMSDRISDTDVASLDAYATSKWGLP